MGYRESTTGEWSSRRSSAAAIGLAGALALTLAACTSSTTAPPRPHRITASTPAPPAEGCVEIVAAEEGPPTPDGTPYAITLVGSWGTSTKPTGEQLTITELSPNPGKPEKQPLVHTAADGALPEPLLYDFAPMEVAARYAVLGTIFLAHGSHTVPVTADCLTHVTVASTPYQQANGGNVPVSNNNGP